MELVEMLFHIGANVSFCADVGKHQTREKNKPD